MLLRVVPDLQAVPGHDPARVGLLDARQQAQQSGLARAVEPQDHHFRGAVDGQVHAGEHLQRAVRLRQGLGGEGHPPAGSGLGEAQAGDLLADLRLPGPGDQLVGAAQHLLGGHGLGRLRAHLLALGAQLLRLAQGALPLLAPSALVLLALFEVGAPARFASR